MDIRGQVELSGVIALNPPVLDCFAMFVRDVVGIHEHHTQVVSFLQVGLSVITDRTETRASPINAH